MADKSKIIIILLSIIALLVLIIAYSFLIRPQISGYVTRKQIEGYDLALKQILEIVSPPRCEPLSIQYGENENDVIHIVAIECYEEPSLED